MRWMRCRQQPLIKLSRLIRVPVAAGHEVHETEQVFQAQLRLLGFDLLPGMGRPVGHPPDIVHAPVQVRPHDVPEFLRAHEGHQRVLPGHLQGPVHGIHPFDGKLHGPPAADDRRSGVHPIHPLGVHRRPAEGLELGLGQEKIKVGHGLTSSMVLIGGSLSKYKIPYLRSSSNFVFPNIFIMFAIYVPNAMSL